MSALSQRFALRSPHSAFSQILEGSKGAEGAKIGYRTSEFVACFHGCIYLRVSQGSHPSDVCYATLKQRARRTQDTSHEGKATAPAPQAGAAQQRPEPSAEPKPREPREPTPTHRNHQGRSEGTGERQNNPPTRTHHEVPTAQI